MSSGGTFRSTPPEVKELSGLRLPYPEVLRTANGIHLNVLSHGAAQACRIGILLPGGLFDAPSRPIAEAASQMLREGAGGLTAAEVAEILDRNGAWMDFSTGMCHRAVHLYALSNRVERLLGPLGDMIAAPQMEADAFRVHLEQRAASAQSNMQTVGFKASSALNELIYGAAHPLSSAPSPEEIRATRLTDVGEFHRRFTRPEAIHITIAGCFPHRLVDSISKIFEELPSRCEPMPQEANHVIEPSDKREIFTPVESAVQSAIAAAIPAIPRNHEDFIKLRIAVMALGGYFGSRLNINIREEKGLTYGISASLISFDSIGTMVINCQTDAAYVPAVKEEIRKEIKRLASGDITADELTRLRRNYLSKLAATLESPFSIMDFHQGAIMLRYPRQYFEEQIREAESITPRVIADMAAKYLNPEHLVFSVAGPLTAAG